MPINTWGGFRRYQKMAHITQFLHKYGEEKPERDSAGNAVIMLQEDLDDMKDDIILSCEDIQEISVDVSSSDEDVIVAAITVAPTPNYKTRRAMLRLTPGWLGVEISGYNRSCANAVNQLRKWLMQPIPLEGTNEQNI